MEVAHLACARQADRGVGRCAAILSLCVAFAWFVSPAFADGSDVSTQGISGGAARGISGGAARGISGGAGRGISGGAGRGISGGAARGISGGALRGISGGAVRGDDPELGQYSSVAVGPVEWILLDGTNAKIGVLGQTFATTSDVAGSVAVGDYVIAAGNDGKLGGAYQTGQAYIAGVSPVTLRGAVSSVDLSRGTMSVGGVTIDYTSYLVADPQFQPQVGQLIEIDGLQPAAGSTLLAASSDRAVVGAYQVDR